MCKYCMIRPASVRCLLKTKNSFNVLNCVNKPVSKENLRENIQQAVNLKASGVIKEERI